MLLPVYTCDFDITSYELDAQMRLRLSSVLRFMQEAAGRHLESRGLTYEYMRQNGVVFLLTRVGLKITRLPAWHECVTVQTWFVRIEGAQFVREMRFCDAGGETLIEAQTLWITADPQSHRIIRPNNNFFKMQPAEGEKVDITAERVAVLKQAPCVGRKEVRYSDLDCNRHLNNAVYADLICDFFPGGFFGREIDRLSIDFFGEALLGEIIEITAGEDARGRVVVSGNTDTHRCFGACVELRDGLGK